MAGTSSTLTQPSYATSWQEEAIKSILEEQGVVRATCDHCLCGCESGAKDPVKKPTTFMTSAPDVDRKLQQRCQGRGGACSRPQGGRHAQCRGKMARMGAVYHFKLCRAILVGFMNKQRKNEVCKDGFICMLESGMEKQELPAVLPCSHLTNDKGSVLKVQV